ncbi:ShlB/FhaC/HecB family hemolysin secretion/activation protein [Glaciimonas sp. PAMC28666]|uniref:ShlB/FhaC/HecB family hemolysin secretion/activation protein n=1 Tax=Glaciimonas sp. PAMC28666 TaxID=2807626 RepID=UPI001964CD36|nr:ShlB/FhaC/HecB family hemolysin secretion/activation protein [Glaciimonas sp. PAMC28666]QRX83430.1 ShlB/FhaC/HecB family hemolysin secretion/activation protein [Glaciimonas sp. PAMC28666]
MLDNKPLHRNILQSAQEGSSKLALFLCLLNYAIPAFCQTDLDRAAEIQNQKNIQSHINTEIHKQEQDQEQDKNISIDEKLPVAKVSTTESFFVSTIKLNSGPNSPSINSRPILEKYEGKNLDKSQIFSLVKDLTNLVFGLGYVTTYVTVDQSDLRTGTLKLSLRWGRIADWLVDGNAPANWHQRLRLNAALPGVVGKILNIKDVDQAIENLGAGGDGKATVKVVAGKELGSSFLDVHFADINSPKFAFSSDNEGAGTDNSGRDGSEIDASFYNLTGLNDSLKLSLTDRVYSDPTNNALVGYGMDYHVPVGAFSFGIKYNNSNNKRLLHALYGDYLSSGIQNTWGARIDTIANRSASSKLVLYANMETKKINNYLAGQKLTASSGRYTNIGVGAEYSTSVFGGSIFSNTEFDRGLTWPSSLDASMDGNDNKKPINRFTLNGAWSRDLTIASQNLNYQLKFGGQYSPTGLIPAYKFSVGNAYTVRAYYGTPYSADNGLYLSNTMTRPVQFEAINLTLSPFIGIDFAILKDAEKLRQSERLLGAAVGVTAAYGNNSILFVIGRPLCTPGTSQPGISQNNVVHLIANFST